jgi:uncharacterized protein YqiB (DUF1249 family)
LQRIVAGITDVTEKRPETDADILSRSKAVTGSALRRAQERALRQAQNRRYHVDLPAHMAECDANYVRLLRLFPDLREKSIQTIALPLPALETQVVFEVLEKGPYTTLVKLDVGAVGDRSDAQAWAELAGAPTMTVRVYHDACSAEVVSYQTQNRFHGSYEYPNLHMHQRDEKVQLNRFLSEFLTLCLEHGASTHTISF